MAKTITSANSVLMIAVTGLFTTPQQLQGFSADDLFDVDSVRRVETQMGADGILSAGWVPIERKMNIRLKADSASNDFFDAWAAAEDTARDVLSANGVAILTGIRTNFVLVNGFLSDYKPMADARKVLMPRGFSITWQSITPNVLVV